MRPKTQKKELNTAILEDSYSKIENSKATLDKAVKDYNKLATVLDYQTLRSKSTPMLAAIEQLAIATIETKANKDKETGIVTYTIEPSSKQISLVAFDEYCQRDKMQIAPDALWKYKIEKFCLLVTYRVMKELGRDTKKLEKTYYISDVAKQVDMGKTPTSNTQILKQLQAIVDAIIFTTDGDKNAYKVTSHDVAYVVQTMTKRGKTSGSVVAPRPQTMHMLVMDVLHRIITEGEYSVEFKAIKDAKKEEEESAAPKTTEA